MVLVDLGVDFGVVDGCGQAGEGAEQECQSWVLEPACERSHCDCSHDVSEDDGSDWQGLGQQAHEGTKSQEVCTHAE